MKNYKNVHENVNGLIHDAPDIKIEPPSTPLEEGQPVMIEIGNSKLFRANCFDVLPLLGEKVEAVVSDMPFGCTKTAWDKVPPLTRFWRAAYGATILTANIVLFCCGKFSQQLSNSNPCGYRYDLVWWKSNPVGFQNTQLMPMRDHESIYIFGRPGHMEKATYNAQKVFNEDNVGKKFGGGGNRGYRSTVYGSIRSVLPHISDGWMHPRSVIPCASDSHGGNRLHNTQKPVSLMEYLILTYTNEGDTVLDPFMGSGSTAVAAIRCNRRFIGIELHEEFFQKAVDRIRQEIERQQ